MTAEPRPVEEIRTDLAALEDEGPVGDYDDRIYVDDLMDRLSADVEPLLARLAAADRENAELGRDVASLTEQIAATDARVVELVGQVAEARALVISLAVEDDPEQIAKFRQRFPSATTFDAALSAAPQPEPVVAVLDAEGARALRAFLRDDPEPPASDEPARCVHGKTRAHRRRLSQAEFLDCPGPAASGTPDEPPIPMHADCPHSETIPMLGSTDWIVCTACGTQISYWPDGGQR